MVRQTLFCRGIKCHTYFKETHDDKITHLRYFEFLPVATFFSRLDAGQVSSYHVNGNSLQLFNNI